MNFSFHYLSKLCSVLILLFVCSYGYGQTCPDDIIAVTDDGQCCAEINFGSKSVINETVVEDNLMLFPGPQSLPITIAYNPDLELYYIGRGGFTTVEISTHDPNDGSELYSEVGNFDYRAVWWNDNNNTLQGNGYNSSGYRTVDLNSDGYALGSGSDVVGMHQPNSQTQCHYDYDADEVIGRHGFTVYRYQLDGTLLGSYTLTGAPSTSWNTYWVGYSGVPGSEIMVFDYISKEVLFFDKATGAYTQSKALPADAPAVNFYDIGYANNRLWVFDDDTYIWKGYVITEDGAGLTSDNEFTYTQTAGLPSGSCFPIGVTENTFTVTDIQTGIVSTCSFTVNVQDLEKPSITCLAAITIPCGTPTTPENTEIPYTSDNCSSNSDLSLTYNDTKVYVAGNEVITRTWTVVDEAGNSETCQQTITLEGITGADSQTAWIQTVDLANLYNDSGNNGGFETFSMNSLLTIDESHTAILSPGYAGLDERVYWRIYIDYNHDGEFQHGAERALQGNAIGPLVKTLTVPETALAGDTKMRITMGTDGYVFPCDSGFMGEVEDYTVNLAECIALTDAGYIGFDQAICPGDDDPYVIGDLFQTANGNGMLEYIWMMNETNCEPTDGTESNGWTFIAGETDSYYDPPALSNSTVFVRGVRQYGCQEYIFSNMVEIVYTEDCIPDCQSEGLSTENEYIFRVRLANVNNVSGDNGGYGDFTHMTVEADPGDKIQYHLRPKFYNGAQVEHWRVWVDWNQDGHFSDLCELVLEVSNDYTQNGNFKVPDDAPYGLTKIRVAMKHGSYPSSCETFANGEVEDYSLMVGSNIVAAAADDAEEKLNVQTFVRSSEEKSFDYQISPNPSSGQIQLEFEQLDDRNEIVIHDQLGKIILSLKDVPADQALLLDLTNYGVTPGLYFVRVNSHERFLSKKLLIVQ